MAEQAPEPANFREAMAQVVSRSSLGQVKPGETPSARALLGAMGGVRGLIESILPGLGFLIVFTITKDLLPSVIAPLALAIVFVVVRIVTRSPVTSAIAGVFGIAVSAVLALITGKAADNFIPGFLINCVIFIGAIVSLIIRRPLIGALVGLLTGDAEWRRDPAKFRVALIATILWAGLFGLRLAVELPLYFANAVDVLAAAKLIMGVPLYAGLLWVTWLMVRTAWRPADEEGDADPDPAA
ncbi:DUF3159 domain-containing protein [soil metagenome]